jgi:5-methylcytosine-specific restriction endonuclease McrA
MIKKCKVCEVCFNGKSRSIYCSMKCMGKDRRGKIDGYKNCLTCNKKFPFRNALKVRTNGGIKSCKSLFCCKKCSDIGTGERNKTKVWTKEDRLKSSELAKKIFTGRVQSKEEREKRRLNNLGSKSHFWKGGITPNSFKERSCMELKEWKREIFKRDNYTCQECGVRGGILNAHHIKSWAKFKELRFDLNNGITLCLECHKLTDNYKGKNA